MGVSVRTNFGGANGNEGEETVSPESRFICQMIRMLAISILCLARGKKEKAIEIANAIDQASSSCITGDHETAYILVKNIEALYCE